MQIFMEGNANIFFWWGEMDFLRRKASFGGRAMQGIGILERQIQLA